MTEPTARAPRRPYAARMAAPQRREQLLDAARDLSLAQGFHAVTIDGVARAAGVTRPVVYGLFTDRRELLAALLDREEQRAIAQLAKVFPAGEQQGDPVALLLAGLEAFLAAVRDTPDTWRVILTPPEGAPPELAARFAAERLRRLDQLRELAAWGLSLGELTGWDAELFAIALQGMSEGAARLLLADPERFSVPRFLTFARSLLERVAG